MRSLSDQEFVETETLLRQRLTQLADHAPTSVQMPDEISVVAVHRRKRNGRQLGAIAAVTALLGAGGFTTYSFLAAGNNGGAATPEEAVTTFVSAIDHSDVLGMIDVTLPEEVGVLRDAVDATTSDAKRLDLIGNNFDASGVKGLDMSFNDLKLDTNYLDSGLATVTATGGSFTLSFDPKTFPFGEKVRALLTDGQASTHTKNLAAATDPPALLMTVQRNGRWYVSLEYTVAEYVRRSAGWDLPDAVTRAPIGFDTPDAAVNAFYDRLAALDLRGALDTFAPGEDAMAWLAQSWIADAEAAITRGRADGWTVGISGLTYETIGSGSHRTLNPITFKLQGTVPPGFAQSSGSYADPTVPTVVYSSDGATQAVLPAGTPVPKTTADLTFTTGVPQVNDGNYNTTTAMPDGTIVPIVFPPSSGDGPKSFTIERADGCTTYLGDGVKNVLGLEGSPSAKPVDGGFKLCGANLFGGLNLLLLTGGLAELPSVSVVESGGKWYVSPLGTALASVSTSLHGVATGSSLFDSPLAPYIYGGLSRSYLESMVVGRGVADWLDPTCLTALTVADGKVTGVVADPTPQAIRACSTALYSSSSSGVGVAPPATSVQEATAPTMVPTQAPQASTP
jgi:hypothetical protein